MANCLPEKRIALQKIVNTDFIERDEFFSCSQILGLDSGNKMILIAMKYNPGFNRNHVSDDQLLLDSGLNEHLKERLSNENSLYVSAVNNAHYIILTDYRLVDLMIEAISAMAEAFKFDYRIGIGSSFTNPEYLAISYREAHDAIFQSRYEEKINTYRAEPNIEKEWLMRFDDLSGRIINALESGAFNEIPTIISGFFDDIRNYELDIAFSLCIESITHILDYFGIEKMRQFMIKYRFDLIGPTKHESFKAIKATYNDNIIRIIDIVKNMKGNPIEYAIKKMQEIVLNDYSNQYLSLYDISRRINISYCYLSKIIKQNMGIGFVEYLTSVRMSHAIKLLLDGGMRICEVATAVGYNSSGYFVTAFTKYYGIPPGEYRMRKNGRSVPGGKDRIVVSSRRTP